MQIEVPHSAQYNRGACTCHRRDSGFPADKRHPLPSTLDTTQRSDGAWRPPDWACIGRTCYVLTLSDTLQGKQGKGKGKQDKQAVTPGGVKKLSKGASKRRRQKAFPLSFGIALILIVHDVAFVWCLDLSLGMKLLTYANS